MRYLHPSLHLASRFVAVALGGLLLAAGFTIAPARADDLPSEPSPLPGERAYCPGVFEPTDDPDGSLEAALAGWLAGGPEGPGCAEIVPPPSGGLGLASSFGGVATSAGENRTELAVPADGVPGDPNEKDPTKIRDVTLRIESRIANRVVDAGASGAIAVTNDRWVTVRDLASQPWWEFRLRGVTRNAFTFDMTSTYLVHLFGRFYAEFTGAASYNVPAGGDFGPGAVPPDVTFNLQFVGFRVLRPPLA